MGSTQSPPGLNTKRFHLGRYEACERCHARHIRCQRASNNRPCRSCEGAKTKCTGRRGSVFRVVQYPLESRIDSPTETRPRIAPSNTNQSPSSNTGKLTTSHSESVSVEEFESQDGGSSAQGELHSARGELELPCQGPNLQVSVPTPGHIFSGHLSGRIWPLKTQFEASLFRYFLTNLSSWFDYCDPHRHFRTHIANAAATDSTILYAILAVSARHQSSSSDEMRLFADECQQNCLKALIPALNDYENAIQETVFASAVILRLFEEMTEPDPREAIISYTLSAQVLIRVRDGVPTSSFIDAAFIVTLRQEIFVANLIQRPVGSITEHCNIDMSLVASSDVMWAFRAIAHAAKVTDFAYDNVSFRTRDRWESLMQYLQDWEALRPASFNPIYREEGNPQSCPFPKLWYCNDYHVAARQYTELSRILLLASDPDTCQMRIGRMRTGRNNDATIRDCVRVICGVALSNTEYMPARLTAGFVISMCGELFHQPDETRVLLAMLSDAESYLGWPCLKSKDDLQRLWGLPD